MGNVRDVRDGRPTGWWARWWPSRREALFDVGLVVIAELFLVALLLPIIPEHGISGLVMQAAFLVVLLVRRLFPLSVLLVMLLSAIGLAAIGDWTPELILSSMGDATQGWIVLAAPFAAYSALVYGADRRRAWLMTAVLMLVASRPWDPLLFERAVGVFMVVGLPALLGAYVANLNERLERAEREQHRLADQARVEERVRLAAEMHDVVTHRVSLMVLQAGALGVTATDAATRAAAEDLRAAGCQALEELRDLVGVLRSAPDDAVEDIDRPRAGGQAGPPDYAELLAESESVGVSVELDQTGNPALASPVVARTAYRIVQEALTNVRKHAPGASVRVILSYQTDRIRLTVRNSAPEHLVDESLTASGSRTGLLGLRQRVELVSGTLRAGPTTEGGFEVDATLPAYVPTREEPAPAEPARPAPTRGRPLFRAARSRGDA